MRARAKLALVVLAVLLVTGAMVQPLAESARGAGGRIPVAPKDASRLAAGGQGVSMAVLGGFRALAADLLWLKTYHAWAARDLPKTRTLIQLVTMADERPLCFWLNGARMLAYDMTRWRLLEAAAANRVPVAVRRGIVEAQAAEALSFLENARRWHPDDAAICVEMANIHLHVRGDPGSAAYWYRQAAELPGAPYYAARIHAELLKKLGRRQEAYTWLCRLHGTLPPREEEAMPRMVLARIRELEKDLAVPADQRYRAPPAKEPAPAIGTAAPVPRPGA